MLCPTSLEGLCEAGHMQCWVHYRTVLGPATAGGVGPATMLEPSLLRVEMEVPFQDMMMQGRRPGVSSVIIGRAVTNF